MSKDYLQRLESMLSSDINDMKQNLMFKIDDRYHLFERYQLQKIKDGVMVIGPGANTQVFSGFRSAVSWCIADKFNKWDLCNEIYLLDQQKSRLEPDVEVTQQLLRKQRPGDIKEITGLKLDHKIMLLKEVKKRLDKCVNLAKYWQLRGFDNEIARTRRPTPNRTHR
jgi:hypothetical protein